MVANADVLKLPWDELPLSLLPDDQQIQFGVKVGRHTTGEVIWSSDAPGSQFLVISGKVRMLSQDKAVILKEGAWFGDLLELSGHWKARASSKEVVVAYWNAELL